MANPQPEQYTKVANELLEQIPRFKFTTTQLDIILVVIRYTYGFKRKTASLAVSFFENATGISKRNLQKEIEKLLSAKVLLQSASFTSRNAREMGLNKNYELWTIEKRMEVNYRTPLEVNCPTPPEKNEEELHDTSRDELHDISEVNYTTPLEVSCGTPKKESIKENFKESIKIASKIPSNCEQFLKTFNIKTIEEIMSYLDDGIEEDLIIEIIRDTAKCANASPVNLCKSILNRCFESGIKTLGAYIQDSSTFNKNKKGGHTNAGSIRDNKQDNIDYNDGLLSYQRRWPETLRKGNEPDDLSEVSGEQYDF